ncbi:hypothetical protein MTR_4g478270 [Medicago truncatula]|uniref:Transmembrane protein n=1 Tax=Medicago truncatula TaxID=3880 RepID=A0A072UMS1_MEDTR|nr:hypothetical protein MTR_4g478270 [Medicago truncatula]
MYVSSSSFSVVLSLLEIMFIKLFVARPTALEVFLAAPTTTGCRDISSKFARSLQSLLGYSICVSGIWNDAVTITVG